MSIGGAPELVTALADSDFGLIPGQKLFTAYDDQLENLLLFATWWPWGDSDSFSLRVGIFCKDEQIINHQEIKEHLIDWLAISDSAIS